METDAGKDEMIHVITTMIEQGDGLTTDAIAEKIVDELIVRSGGSDHIVSVGDGEWTLQHPVTERFDGELFECPMVERTNRLAIQGAFSPGFHRIYVGDHGYVMWEEVGA